jgi:hypothetical protein
MQMYIVEQKGGYSPESSAELQRFVRQCNGFILMVTQSGPLVALDDDQVAVVANHPLVNFVGPVMLNPRGLAADRLERIFAENLSQQLDLDHLDNVEPSS